MLKVQEHQIKNTSQKRLRREVMKNLIQIIKNQL